MAIRKIEAASLGATALRKAADISTSSPSDTVAPSEAAVAALIAALAQAFKSVSRVVESGTSVTLSGTHAGKTVEFTAAGEKTLTINSTGDPALVTDQATQIFNASATDLVVVAGDGVTTDGEGLTIGPKKGATLWRVGSSATWYLVGGLSE